MSQVWPVIATRGRSDYLRKQLDALTPQLQDDERIVVVVDGDPATVDALKTHAASVLVYPIAARVGVYEARRIGNSRVPTDAVVCEIDDHDIAEPTLLAELRKAFSDKAVMLAYCDVYHVAKGDALDKRKLREKSDRLCRESGQLGWGLKAYRKWVYDCVGGYPLGYETAGDYALMVMLERFANDAIKHIATPLVTVLEDLDGISATNKDTRNRVVCSVAQEALNDEMRFPFRLLEDVGGGMEADTEVVALGDTAWTPTQPAKAQKRPVVLYLADYLGHGRGGGEVTMLAAMERLKDRGFEPHAMYLKTTGAGVPEWLKAAKLEGGGYAEAATQKRAVAQVIALSPCLVLMGSDVGAHMTLRLRNKGLRTLSWMHFWRGCLALTEATWAALAAGDAPDKDVAGCANLGAADALVANSEYTAGVAGKAIGRKPSVVRPFIDVAQVVGDGMPLDARPYIVCASTQPGKGADVFLAMARQRPEQKFLLLAGDLADMGSEEIVKQADALSNVEVRREWVEDMRPVYSHARVVFVGTRTAETYCRVAAEARANGVPLLVSANGNLPAMADGGHGVTVPADAALPKWLEGLDAALALTPEREDLPDDTDKLLTAVNGARGFPEVAVLTPPAAGVGAACREMQAVLGVSMLPWGSPPAAYGGAALGIVTGHYDKGVDAAVTGRLAFWWCSHLAQMDTHRHEMRVCTAALEAIAKRGDRWFLMTCKADAETLAQVCKTDRIKWLPACYKMPEPVTVERLDGRHVFLPGPYAIRKNVYAAIAAIGKVGATAHVTSWFHEAANATEFAKALGVKLAIHECETREDIRNLAARCSASLVASTAETFSYAAADCISAGAVTIGSTAVPVLRYAPSEFVLRDATDTGETAEKLDLVFREPAVMHKRQGLERDALAKLAAEHNAAARKCLLEILA